MAALLGAIEIDSRLSGLDIKAPVQDMEGVVHHSLKKGPVIIAFSVMSTQLERVKREVSELRGLYNDSVVLVSGGPHASARPLDLLDIGFDYVVVGEGEYSFPELVYGLHSGDDIGSIPGVVTKDIDDHPRPRDFPKIVLDDYPPFALALNIVGPVEVTRGCPYNCKFCSTPFLTGARVRHRSVERVTHWLKRAVNERGFKRTWFLSPNALCYGGKGRSVELNKLETLLKAATSIDGLDEVFFGAFPSEVRPEFITKRALDMLRHYVANQTLQIGIQSGSDRVLKIANRHHTVEEGLDGVRTALECGFTPHVDMIFDLPGETKDEVRASLDLCYNLIEMGAKIHGHVFMPLPGSAFENMPPGRLDDETRKELGEMARKGLLTGSWSNQENLAEGLASSQE